MINLLPIENKKNVWIDYCHRRAIIFCTILALIFLTAVILTSTFYFSVRMGWNNNKEDNAKVNFNLVEYEKKLQDLKQDLSTYSDSKMTISIIDIFEKITKTKTAGIKIEAFKYEGLDKGKMVIKMQINASTRKIASEYISKLKSVDGVLEVEHPILTGDRNLDVPLNIVFRKK